MTERKLKPSERLIELINNYRFYNRGTHRYTIYLDEAQKAVDQIIKEEKYKLLEKLEDKRSKAASPEIFEYLDELIFELKQENE